ncbi:MAG: aspartate aminotransferase family protein [Bacillota bacterium]|nr:aspartate aminotransferase family protein [Bacillota bacterium]
MTENNNLKELDSLYVANTYAKFPVEIAYGKGSFVWDNEGKKYIDMATGIAVNAFGVADEEWIKAVTDQMLKYQHTSNLYYTEPCVKLAKLLCEKTDMKKVFFCNSGAEANEGAIKAARKYAKEKHGADFYKIITLVNSFHGRTITTLAATGQDSFHNDFLPLTEGFLYAEAGNIEAIKNLIKENKTAAIMIEVVQGEGGVIALDKDYVKALYELCLENDILLICDEVQTGNGRTGMLYGYMNYEVMPDIVSTAKGIGGGLPIGAVMLGEKVKDVLTPGTHGSTFGGNPVCCAGAYNIMSRIDDALLNEVREKSSYIINELSKAKGIKSVTGMGLMLGLETEKDASQFIKECTDNGVLVIKAKNKVRLLPALNIPKEVLTEAIEVIKKVAQ